MQILPLCKVKEGHSAISHLCLFQNCKNDLRWACNLIELISLRKDGHELVEQINKDLFTLNRQQINRIISFQCEVNNKQNSNKIVEQIQQEKSDFNNNIEDQNMNYALYYEKQLKQRYTSYNAPQISPNDKFLIFGVNTRLSIFDLPSKQRLKTIRLKNYISISIFSEDSQYLFCWCGKSQLLCFKVNQNFKLVGRLFYFNLHFYKEDLIIINPHLVLYFYGRKIIIINFKNKKQQQIINNFDGSRKIITPEDAFIKFIKIPDLKIIMDQKFNNMSRIQLLSSDLLLSTEIKIKNNLCLWKINYQKKEITLFKQFNCQQNINNFSYIKPAAMIIIKCEDQIKIVNSDFQIIQIISHEFYKIRLKL
ncbi:hypothetical protein pb186bvf_015966 [Paramecium bursaria]